PSLPVFPSQELIRLWEIGDLHLRCVVHYLLSGAQRHGTQIDRFGDRPRQQETARRLFLLAEGIDPHVVGRRIFLCRERTIALHATLRQQSRTLVAKTAEYLSLVTDEHHSFRR